ncbi:Molybdopterin-synthase sulfurtransferase [Neoconidiobolus thromboides FSU 785]|nr:Molybdopterin-synthase sulfurtransferase [Neoconidiobolus thromboides FSU 785]
MTSNNLSNAEIRRYGRQLILPIMGIGGQRKLKQSKVLIVGAGGLGSPAGLYLAAAGVGKIGIIDHDLVDASNLHRQIIHTESREGHYKALSAKMAIQNINSFCECIAYCEVLDTKNAMEIFQGYDVILDCTDNVVTRYLINDTCVLLNKPLVSGSALRLHGQILIYNYLNGPCYRCLYPIPPPADTVTNCADGGVLGPVTGIIGSLQAIEAIKILIEYYNQDNYQPYMTLYSADRVPNFNSIKLRQKQKKCQICGENRTITELQDYEQFCNSSILDKAPSLELLNNNQRITVTEFNDWLNLHASILPFILLDVREPIQFEICHLPMAIKPVLFINCRLGNDSQLAVAKLNQLFQQEGLKAYPQVILDVRGGLYAWSKQIDDQFPIY